MPKLLLKEEKTNLQVTKNFNMSEMEFYDRVPANLLEKAKEVLANVQILRDALGVPVSIMSGYRSPERNAEVGGATKSQHMEGNATDLQCKAKTPLEMYTMVEKLIKEGKMKQGGLGIYDGWIHYDCRGTRQRWDNRTKDKGKF
jgi:uncharacterized protein YcbK (DUF882 family)